VDVPAYRGRKQALQLYKSIAMVVKFGKGIFFPINVTLSLDFSFLDEKNRIPRSDRSSSQTLSAVHLRVRTLELHTRLENTTPSLFSPSKLKVRTLKNGIRL